MLIAADICVKHTASLHVDSSEFPRVNVALIFEVMMHSL